AGGDGIQRALALVRAFAAGLAVRVVDRGRSRDPHQAGAQAEDGSPGCAAATATDGGESLPADLGAGRRESRSATTAMASASLGADAHASDESVARGRAQ